MGQWTRLSSKGSVKSCLIEMTVLIQIWWKDTEDKLLLAVCAMWGHRSYLCSKALVTEFNSEHVCFFLQILSGIVKDCLNKAEDNSFISITFPAIGTGNLKFPKDLIAQLMLDEIIKFSKKIQPKFLKKVVIILHPGDAATVQVNKEKRNNSVSWCWF